MKKFKKVLLPQGTQRLRKDHNDKYLQIKSLHTLRFCPCVPCGKVFRLIGHPSLYVLNYDKLGMYTKRSEIKIDNGERGYPQRTN